MSTASFQASALHTAADRVMAQSGKTFYRAARLLPKSVRGPVTALYAFCRRVDDLADEPGQPSAVRGEALAALAGAFAGQDRGVLAAAGWPFAASGQMAEAGRLLVLAAQGDLEQRQPEDEQELLGYAFGVAGTVGVMMATVLGARPEGGSAGVALGMAMQMSNIVRDVAEDQRQGRVYLPATWVSALDVRRVLVDPDGDLAARAALCDATWKTLVLADSLYAVAFGGVKTLPWRVRWSILAAALCYREIGVAVGHDIEASWRRRTVVSGGRKVWLIAKAGLLLLLPRYWMGAPRSFAGAALGRVAVQQCRQLGVPTAWGAR